VLAPGHVNERVRASPDGTYTAPLGEIRERLRVFDESKEEFVARMTGELPPQPANAERIVAINLGQETVEDEEAFELELGPNNCAASVD
jgi:hypothetical protein